MSNTKNVNYEALLYKSSSDSSSINLVPFSPEQENLLENLNPNEIKPDNSKKTNSGSLLKTTDPHTKTNNRSNTLVFQESNYIDISNAQLRNRSDLNYTHLNLKDKVNLNHNEINNKKREKYEKKNIEMIYLDKNIEISSNFEEKDIQLLQANKKEDVDSSVDDDIDKEITLIRKTKPESLNNNNNNNEDDNLMNFQRTNKKRRSTTRPKTILYHKKDMTITPAQMTKMIQKSEHHSEYGKYKRLIKITDFILAVLVVINVTLSIIDNEIYINYSDAFLKDYMTEKSISLVDLNVLQILETRQISTEENFFRTVNSIIAATSIILVIIHYVYYLRILKIDQQFSIYDNLWTSKLYKPMVVEMLICCIFYPPALNKIISGRMLGLIYAYNWNSIISIAVMCKLYILLRVYTYFSKWTSDIANAVCNKHKVKTGIHFAVKSELKKRPFKMLTVMLIFWMILLAFAIRTFEYGVFMPDNSAKGIKGSNDLQLLSNCFWLIIVTMTTVGFGDYYPKSHLGRLIGVIACIIGMLILSLIVVSLASVTEFTQEEKKAYSIIKKLQADNNVYTKAANVISRVLIIRKRLKSRPEYGINRLTETFILFTQLKRDVSYFKNDFKIASSFPLPIDEMLKRLETKIKEDIKNLTKNIKKIDGLDVHLKTIAEDQQMIETKLDKILFMQEAISDYLVNLNNETYLENMKIRKKSIDFTNMTIRKKSSVISSEFSNNMSRPSIKNKPQSGNLAKFSVLSNLFNKKDNINFISNHYQYNNNNNNENNLNNNSNSPYITPATRKQTN